MADRSVSRTTTVAAPPQEIFELLATPSRHPELDGSGTVRRKLSGPDRITEAGQRFRMGMRIGLPYLIGIVVTEFEEGRRIAWRHVGRHVWRWTLEPVEDGTRVTEEFDWAPALVPPLLEWARVPAMNANSIKKTLANLEERFGAAG